MQLESYPGPPGFASFHKHLSDCPPCVRTVLCSPALRCMHSILFRITVGLYPHSSGVNSPEPGRGSWWGQGTPR